MRNYFAEIPQSEGYMTGKLLVAMPYIYDARFNHAVIYICGHDSQGAIGIVTNKVFPSLTFKDFLRQLDIHPSPKCQNNTLYYGGPLEVSRGFVLHSPDFQAESTVVIDDHFGITSTLEILRVIAKGEGPTHNLITLGYTGWNAGNLEQEIQENVWMVVEANENLVFNTTLESKWRLSLEQLGVDPLTLSIESGHA